VGNFIQGGFVFTESIDEGFEGYADADFVAVFEAVYYGAGGSGDFDGDAFDDVGFDAVLEGGFGEAEDAEAEGVYFWRAGALRDADVNVIGELCCEVVEGEGGEETDDGVGGEGCDLDQGVVDREVVVCGHVEAAGEFHDFTGGAETADLLGVKAHVCGVCEAKGAFGVEAFGEFVMG